jgi:hypothetical protein
MESVFPLDAALMTFEETEMQLHDASLIRNSGRRRAKSAITVRAEDFLLYYLARRF